MTMMSFSWEAPENEELPGQEPLFGELEVIEEEPVPNDMQDQINTLTARVEALERAVWAIRDGMQSLVRQNWGGV